MGSVGFYMTLLTSAFLLVDQVVDFTWLTNIEHITLTGALIVAVSILWKSNSKKDDQLVENTKTLTTSLLTITSSNIELRKVIEESIEVKESLKESIIRMSDGLNKLYCVYNPDKMIHLEKREKGQGAF